MNNLTTKTVITILISFTSASWGCSCMEAYNWEERFQQHYDDADLVALAKITNSVWDAKQNATSSTLEIKTLWKGDKSTTNLITPPDDCSEYLKVGKTYYIFATHELTYNALVPMGCGYTVKRSIFNDESLFVSRHLKKID